MDPKRWETIKSILDQAFDLQGGEREAALERLCGDDDDLRREVESIIAADRVAEDPALFDDPMPQQIGPFRLERKLGAGGMGVVYLAHQEQPIRRDVAIKLIKIGMDTHEVVARFEQERQTLALMQHPGIANVIDAGATEDGRPYFVMEYVDGEPITEYCDRRRLDSGERLRLFSEVCDAIQHAHQKGAIHRDIKPSNVLVLEQDGRPMPKVIDFGIAKAVHLGETERSLFTATGHIVGTPEYMSPEQASMSDRQVDTRTDVYSLGVLLYELLVGARPFSAARLRDAAFDELLRIVREEEPVRPSTRVTTREAGADEAARERRSDPASLARELRRDLDWIVMRALEKDPARRYATVTDLAGDIGRYLRDEPVQAGPPSASYRARKFVRRHRVEVAAAAVVLLVLLLGIAGSLTGLVQARRAETRARREAATSERTTKFLANLIGGVDVESAGRLILQDVRVQVRKEHRNGEAEDDELTLERFDEILGLANTADTGRRIIDAEMLEPAAATIESEMTEDPELAARLFVTLAVAYMRLDLPVAAGGHLKRALELLERTPGSVTLDPLYVQTLLAQSFAGQGRYDDAEALFNRTLASQLERWDASHPDVLRTKHGLASMFMGIHRNDEARALLAEVLDSRERSLGPGHDETLSTMESLASVSLLQSRFDEAEGLYRDVLAHRIKELGPEHPSSLRSKSNVAAVLVKQSRLEQAEALFREVLPVQRRVLGENDGDTLNSTMNLASLLQRRGRFDEAEDLLQRTLDRQREVHGANHPLTLTSRELLANIYLDQGRYSKAEQIYRDLLETRTRLFGDDNPATLHVLDNLATTLSNSGRLLESEPLTRRAFEKRKRVLGMEHQATLKSMTGLANLYQQLERWDEAEPIYLEALEARRRLLGDEHMDVFYSLYNLAFLYKNQSRLDDSEPLYVEALRVARNVLGPDHPHTLVCMEGLTDLYVQTGQVRDARPLALELLTGWKSRATELDDPESKFQYADQLLKIRPEDLRDPESALQFADEANALAGGSEWKFVDIVARAHASLGNTATAVELQREALALLPDGNDSVRREMELRLEKMQPAPGAR